ncbi:MAG: thioredoxin domain-containing protein, partial [Pirellulales bacterium]
VAAGASLWFIGVQVFAIGTLCKYCLVADVCGVAIGAITTFFAVRCWLANRGTPQPRTMQPGLLALRTAFPTGVRPAPPTAPVAASPPSLGYALGGALPLLALLIGGQILFAAKTYEVQKVALADSIDMTGSNDDKSGDDAETPTTRVPSETDTKPVGEVPPELNSAKSAETVAETPTAKNGSAGVSPAQPPPPATEPSRERLVKFLGGKLTLDAYKHPLIGSPDAPHIVVELVSYDCPHCRKVHTFVQEALERYGDQVALLVMPVPLDLDCNKLVTDPAASHQGACGTARRAISIARLNPSAFVKFHDFLMTGKDKPPAMERIVPKANGLVDRDRLRELVNGPEVAKQLESYIDLYSQLQNKSHNSKSFGLPVQILGDNVMSGAVEKPEDVFKAWEENLGVKPK